MRTASPRHAATASATASRSANATTSSPRAERDPGERPVGDHEGGPGQREQQLIGGVDAGIGQEALVVGQHRDAIDPPQAATPGPDHAGLRALEHHAALVDGHRRERAVQAEERRRAPGRERERATGTCDFADARLRGDEAIERARGRDARAWAVALPAERLGDRRLRPVPS